MAVHIGTSGWSYDHWAGVLYPKGASSLGRLDAYTKHFQTVEVTAQVSDAERITLLLQKASAAGKVDATADELREAFGAFGRVLAVHVVDDPATGHPRGFAFVEMNEGGAEAVAALHGARFRGRTLT